VTVVFVTGMSGTGKSSALAELARRGHRVVDTDYGGWIEGEAEPLWREDRIRASSQSEGATGAPRPLPGCSRSRCRRSTHFR
jgi:hypothetical protein